MSLSDSTENSLLKLILNATTWTGLADNTATSPNTNIYVALHTADPGEAGNQSTSEATYTGYARVAVARTTGGWTVTGSSASPNSAITFPAGTGGSGTVTYASLGLSSTGAGVIIVSGAVSPSIVTGNGVTPILGTGTTFTFD